MDNKKREIKMEKTEIVKIIADSYLELAKENYDSGNEILASRLSYIAFGFYRSIEDIKGIQNSNKYVQEENKEPIQKIVDIIDKINFSPLASYFCALPSDAGFKNLIKATIKVDIREAMVGEDF